MNNPNFVHFSYERYLENKLRELFKFTGSPIKTTLERRFNMKVGIIGGGAWGRTRRPLIENMNALIYDTNCNLVKIKLIKNMNISFLM